MSLRKNVGANLFGQGWASLVGLAFIPLYIQFIGVEAYGLIGIFALLQAWLSLLDFGLTPTISREMARFTAGGHDAQSIRNLLRSVEISMLVVAGIVAAAIWLSSGWLAAEWLRAEALPLAVVAQALAIMGVVVGLRFIEGIYRSSAVGLQRQVSLNVATSLLATLRAVGAVGILAWVSPTVIAFFLWQGLVSAISVCVLALVVHRSLPPAAGATSLSLNPLRSIWRFAGGTLLVTLLGFLLSQSDKVILSATLSLSAFAVYSVAYTVASAVRLIAQPIDQAVFPRLTQLHQLGDRAGLANLYHKTSQYNAVLMGSVGLFIAVFGHDVLALWMQDSALAADTYAILWILVIGMVLNGLMNTPYYLQMATGWTDLLVKVNAVLVVLFVPATYVLTQRFQATGAAIAWVLLNVTYVVAVARLMHRRLLRGELGEWYTKDLLMPLSAGAATALALRFLMPTQGGALVTVLYLALSLACVVSASALASGHVRAELTGQLRLVLRKTQ
jgi:O-antigen/teichoic acid export membrane protein